MAYAVYGFFNYLRIACAIYKLLYSLQMTYADHKYFFHSCKSVNVRYEYIFLIDLNHHGSPLYRSTVAFTNHG